MQAELITRPSMVPGGQALLDAFLAGRNEATRRAYGSDLARFAAFVGADDVDSAAALLRSSGLGPANGMALQWRASMVESGLAPASINRRLAALRSLVKVMRTLGVLTWTLEVPSVRSEKYRDTRGPGRDAVVRMIRYLGEQPGDKAIRDLAILRLLWDLGLRRCELIRLDVADVDLDGASVSILGKDRTERERLTLPVQTVNALTAWLEVRGSDPGPLFLNFDRAGKGARLSGKSVLRVVASVGRRVGIPHVTPHQIRHSTITTAIILRNGDVAAVQRFSRHRDVRTLMRYNDNLSDVGGEIASELAAEAA